MCTCPPERRVGRSCDADGVRAGLVETASPRTSESVSGPSPSPGVTNGTYAICVRAATSIDDGDALDSMVLSVLAMEAWLDSRGWDEPPIVLALDDVTGD